MGASFYTGPAQMRKGEEEESIVSAVDCLRTPRRNASFSREGIGAF